MAVPLVRVDVAGSRYALEAVRQDSDDADYAIYVADWRPKQPELELLRAGASLAIAVAHVDPPHLLLQVSPPACERCGKDMTYNAKLGAYVCTEREDD